MGQQLSFVLLTVRMVPLPSGSDFDFDNKISWDELSACRVTELGEYRKMLEPHVVLRVKTTQFSDCGER